MYNLICSWVCLFAAWVQSLICQIPCQVFPIVAQVFPIMGMIFTIPGDIDFQCHVSIKSDNMIFSGVFAACVRSQIFPIPFRILPITIQIFPIRAMLFTIPGDMYFQGHVSIKSDNMICSWVCLFAAWVRSLICPIPCQFCLILARIFQFPEMIFTIPGCHVSIKSDNMIFSWVCLFAAWGRSLIFPIPCPIFPIDGTDVSNSGYDFYNPRRH